MTLIRQAANRTAAASLIMLASAALFNAGCATTKVSETPPSDVDLSGAWVLDQQLSEDTQGVIQTAMTASRSSSDNDARGRGGRGDGSGMRGLGGLFGRSGGRGGSESARQDRGPREPLDLIAAELSPSTDEVTIDQGTNELAVQYGNEVTRRHKFGEEVVVFVATGSGKQISGWQEHQYVVVTETANGTTVTERFTLAPDRTQLQIALSIESKRLSYIVTATRVFARSTEITPTAATR